MKKFYSFIVFMLAAFFAVNANAVVIETDLTSQFNSLTLQSSWTGASGFTATNFCPMVTTNAGKTTQVLENYQGNCSALGDIMTATVKGLAPGTYKIELYGGAAYTWGRGFSSDLFSNTTNPETGSAWQAGEAYTLEMASHGDGVTYPSETGVELYASSEDVEYGGQIPVYYATEFPDGAATVTIEGIVVGASGSIKIGIRKTAAYTNWHVVMLKGVTAQMDADAALAAAVESANAIDKGAIPTSVAHELNDVVAANNKTFATADEYVAAIDAINAAVNKASAFADGAAYFTKMGDVLDRTNVYTQEAYDKYYGTWKAEYDAGTIDLATLSTLTENAAYANGWHSTNNIDDILLSSWTIGGAQCHEFTTPLYINTWSVEGNSDGTNFLVPFFEYWTGDGESLGANTLVGTIEGLTPGATYNVDVWTRVRYKNGATEAPYGITLKAGDGTPVDVCAGEEVSGSQFYIGNFTVSGIANADGVLTIAFDVEEDNNISWLSYRDVYYTLDSDEPIVEIKEVEVDGIKYKLVGDNLFANGSFDEGVDGWKTVGYTTDAIIDNFVYATEGGFDGGAFITTNGAGVGSENTLRQSVAVEDGKTYYFAVYTSGKAPDANNFNYNALFQMTDGATENGVLKAFEWPQGAGNISEVWSKTEFVFTATEENPFVGVRMGWNQSSSFDGFALYEAEMLTSELDAAKAKLTAQIEKLGPIGEGLFMYAQADIDAALAAVQAATSLEELEAITTPQPTKPEEGQAYTLTLTTSDGEFGMLIDPEASNKISIVAADESEIYFYEQEDGTFAIGDGTYYVAYEGINNWTQTAATEAYGWTITALADGGYTIKGKNGFLGTNSSDGNAAGSPCYGDKNTSNGNCVWNIYLAGDKPEPAELIVNAAYLDGYNGWTYTENGFKSRSYEAPMNLITYSGNCEFEVSQVIENVPSGLYKLTVHAFYRAGDVPDEQAVIDNGGEPEKNLTMYAEIAAEDHTYSQKVMNLSEGGSETSHDASDKTMTVGGKTLYVPANAAASRQWYIDGEYVNEVLFNVFEDNDVKIGLSKSVGLPSDYCPIGSWSLERIGAADESKATPDGGGEPTPEPETYDVAIYDVETGMYLGGANDWGTQASLIERPIFFTVSTLENGNVNLDSHTYNNASAHFLGANGYVDATAAEIELVDVDGAYKLKYAGTENYVGRGEGTTLNATATADEAVVWNFIYPESLYKDLESGVSNDATFLLKDAAISRNLYNPSFEAVWEGDSFSKGGENSNQNAEKWGGNSNEFNVYQTIGLPNGTYNITANGFYRYNNTTDNTNAIAISSHADGTEEINSFLYANDVEVPLKSIADDEAVEVLGVNDADEPNIPFSQTAASAAFAQGLYLNELTVEVTDGTLTVGVKKTSHPGCDWTVWDNFVITKVVEKADVLDLTLDVERETGQGYGATVAEVDFAEALAFLGVEEITTDMLRIVNPDNELISDYAPFDGWFNEEGVATTWGENTKVCVKFFQALEDGTYEICDMNGADEVGKTYTVRWALVANDKTVNYTINVTFVKPAQVELAISDLVVKASVEYTDEEGDYTEKIVTLSDEDIAAILSELGAADLSELTFYGYNPTTKELVANYDGYDGWRDPNGDFHGWTGNTEVPACVKMTDGKNYYCYNINGARGTISTYWAIANDTKAVLVQIDMIYPEEEVEIPTYYPTAGTFACDAAFWTEFSPDYYDINDGESMRFQFYNYNDGGENWDNWLLGAANEERYATDAYNEFFILRADNIGWGSNYGTVANTYDWGNFMSEYNGAFVDMVVTYKDGVITAHCDVTSAAGNEYTYDFTSTGVITGTVKLFFLVEKACMSQLSPEEVAVAINSVENSRNASISDAIANGRVFDLSGRKVGAITKGGIYIVDGRKFMVK